MWCIYKQMGRRSPVQMRRSEQATKPWPSIASPALIPKLLLELSALGGAKEYLSLKKTDLCQPMCRLPT